MTSISGRIGFHRNLLRASVLAFAIALPAATAVAGDAVKPQIRNHYYPIRGTSSAELKAQMKANGPNGWWAYTTWYVRWTGDCRVSLTIDYTMPKWTNAAAAPAKLRSAWDRMYANLKAHEEGHGRHGIEAAREVAQSKCKGDPRRITNKWATQDKVYDAKTNHGVAQGVVLP